MSSKENFEALKPKYEAIPEDLIKEPNLPVEIAVDEALNLYEIASKDKEQLGATDLDLILIDDLVIRAEGLRYSETLWTLVFTEKSDAEEEWKLLSKEAFDLRDELLHYCRYAYRKDSKLMDIVNRIAEGYGNADMVMDLSELAMLGKNNPTPLTGVNYDLTNLDRASQLSDRCGILLGKVNGVRTKNEKPAKEMRDRAFTYLKEGVDAIREAGKFVFWKDPERVKLYSSAYYREQAQNRKKKIAEL